VIAQWVRAAATLVWVLAAAGALAFARESSVASDAESFSTAVE